MLNTFLNPDDFTVERFVFAQLPREVRAGSLECVDSVAKLGEISGERVFVDIGHGGASCRTGRFKRGQVNSIEN
jgi:hypothetical protein